MDNWPIRTKLTIKKNNKIYEVCSMNVNMNKQEFYYTFLYPKVMPSRMYNYTEQKWTGRPDHISFHADGTVHLRLKDDKRIHAVQMSDHSFLPSTKKITPLLIHSVFERQGEYIVPKTSELKPISSDRLYTVRNCLIENCQNFSIILFLVPENINLEESLGDTYCCMSLDCKLPLSLLGHRVGRILAWPEWTIDCLITDLTLSMSNNDYYSAFAYCDLNKAIPDLLKQRIDKQANC